MRNSGDSSTPPKNHFFQKLKLKLWSIFGVFYHLTDASGIKLSWNLQRYYILPLRVKNIKEVWRRWHPSIEPYFLKIYPFFKSNLPLENDVIAKIRFYSLRLEFSRRFQKTDLIGFAVALWRSAQTENLFRGFWSLSKFSRVPGSGDSMSENLRPLH